MHNILVTGGAGFIGFNFIRYWLRRHPGDRIINLDALTYAANPANVELMQGEPRHVFVHGDICDQALVLDIFKREEIDLVVHFAAESHVDRSILGPDAFVQTNVLGTFNLLQAARLSWKEPENKRFIHISTDEVYGSLRPDEAAFTEDSVYMPNSPYSASKASADHFARAFYRTYNLPVIISNCSNNYGPYQHPEKLIPLCIINGLLQKKIPVYGDGLNIRDWLHVEDHCRGLELLLQKGKPGRRYNLGSQGQKTNLEIIRAICDYLDQMEAAGFSRRELISFIPDRPGHDRRYCMDASRISSELGWQPEYDLNSGLEQTIGWYIQNRIWWERLLNSDFERYYQHQYNRGQG